MLRWDSMASSPSFPDWWRNIMRVFSCGNQWAALIYTSQGDVTLQVSMHSKCCCRYIYFTELCWNSFHAKMLKQHPADQSCVQKEWRWTHPYVLLREKFLSNSSTRYGTFWYCVIICDRVVNLLFTLDNAGCTYAYINHNAIKLSHVWDSSMRELPVRFNFNKFNTRPAKKESTVSAMWNIQCNVMCHTKWQFGYCHEVWHLRHFKNSLYQGCWE